MLRTVVASCMLGFSLLARPAAAQEQTGLYVSAFTGGAWPVGGMNVIYDPSFMAGGRAELSLGPLVRAGVQLSFASFDAERGADLDNEGVVNLSLYGKALGRWGPYQPFALLGVGAYVSKEIETSGRRWDGGVQFGGGFELPVSEYMSATVGTAIHAVLRGGEQGDYVWIDGYLGFVFKAP